MAWGRSIKQWLAAGRVRVNGTVARDARAEVARGDKVTLGPPTVAPPRAARLPLGLRIVHEDETLLVVDKPPGLLTIGTERERTRTTYRILWDHLAAQRKDGRPYLEQHLPPSDSRMVANLDVMLAGGLSTGSTSTRRACWSSPRRYRPRRRSRLSSRRATWTAATWRWWKARYGWTRAP